MKFVAAILSIAVGFALFQSSPMVTTAQGNGQGLGQPRKIDLLPVQTSGLFAMANGRVQINGAYSDNHPLFPGFPSNINYHVQDMFCRDRGFDTVFDNGKGIFALYMETPSTGRVRLQSFNTDCTNFQASNTRWLEGYSETVLHDESMCVEVWLESDDGLDASTSGGGTLILRGEDGDSPPCS